MKLLIASDIHGAADCCRSLLDAWDREGADRLLLLGDILYHGPRNDLPPAYAPKQVLALLNARRDRIFCVRGNCDTEVDQMVLEFPILADYAVLTAGQRLIYATHGHRYNTAHLPPLHPGIFCCTATPISPRGSSSAVTTCISTPARSRSPRKTAPAAI